MPEFMLNIDAALANSSLNIVQEVHGRYEE